MDQSGLQNSKKYSVLESLTDFMKCKPLPSPAKLSLFLYYFAARFAFLDQFIE